MQSPTEIQLADLLEEYMKGIRPLGMTESRTCAYQTPEGNRCIIGNFLPNNPTILRDHKSVWGLIQRYSELSYLVESCSLKYLTTAQHCHDCLVECITDEQEGQVYTSLFIDGLRYLRRISETQEAREKIDELINYALQH